MAHLTTDVPHVTIVGGGFAGTLTLTHLIRQAQGPLRITMIEKSGRLARGAAYGTAYPYHLLNVRTDRMGAFPEAPDDFLRWTQAPAGRAAAESLCPGVSIRAEGYAPRKLYGAYLEGILQNALSEAARKQIEVVLLAQEASEATLSPELHIILKDHSSLRADALIVATGNAPPRRFSFLHPVIDDDRLVEDIWALAPRGLHASRIAPLSASDHVCIIGSGLTAVDAVLTLHHHGYSGKITLLSRHGLLPAVHADGFTPKAPRLTGEHPRTALGLLASLRQEVKSSHNDWRGLVDGLRPYTTPLWQSLSTPEKQRFLARLFSVWNIHRHRMAPEIGAVLDDLKNQGRLRVISGSIQKVEAFSTHLTVTSQSHGNSTYLKAQMLINCAGPDYDVTSPSNPFLSKMCTRELMIPSPLRWGVKLASDGSAQGNAEGKIFPLGTLRIEEELECTAVPELRVQAKTIAEAVLRSLVQRLH